MNSGRDEKENIEAEVRKNVLRRLLQVGVVTFLQALVLFVFSGRLDWMAAWAYVAILVAVPIINCTLILPTNRELIAERAQIKSVRPWDRAIIAFVTPLPFIALILAGLDVRFGWTQGVSLPIQVLGFMFTVLGYGLLSWAFVSNKYFSTTVRIQTERGHNVVSVGPYRYVRHPGYSGMISASLATPLLLGSLWAVIPMVLVAVGYVARTALEDRTLRTELEGYEEYSKHTQYRLVPGLW